MPIEDIIKGKTSSSSSSSSDQTNKSALVYTIEFLAHLAMSPLCLGAPTDWERISRDYPFLIRNVSIAVSLAGIDHNYFFLQTGDTFDAKQYLSTRTGEPTCVLSADDVDSADV